MPKIDAILDKLHKARKTGRDSYVACCPAHEDAKPSMTLRETSEGTILMHCFGGCSIEAILSAIGIEFDALFPDRPQQDHAPPLRRPFPAADVLEALATESMIVCIASIDARNGFEPDIDRLMLAQERILEGRRLANG
mgnify:CR=1 FL=1